MCNGYLVHLAVTDNRRYGHMIVLLMHDYHTKGHGMYQRGGMRAGYENSNDVYALQHHCAECI
jgi:hypothetical protein